MSASPAAATSHGAIGQPSWAVELAHYNRHLELIGIDNLRHRRGYDVAAPQWSTIDRLLRPLDEARMSMRPPGLRYHQRAVNDAIGLVLVRCAEERTTFWAWSSTEWARLIGATVAEFERPWPGWLDGTSRPYVAGFAYLLGGFTDFGALGSFNRLALAWRVFGREPVEQAQEQLKTILGQWGYRIGHTNDQRLPTVLCQALLLNRSPRLADLTTEVFARLRVDPSMAGWHVGALQDHLQGATPGQPVPVADRRHHHDRTT